MYSEGHKHVTDVNLDSTVMLLDRILLLQGLFIRDRDEGSAKMVARPWVLTLHRVQCHAKHSRIQT